VQSTLLQVLSAKSCIGSLYGRYRGGIKNASASGTTVLHERISMLPDLSMRRAAGVGICQFAFGLMLAIGISTWSSAAPFVAKRPGLIERYLGYGWNKNTVDSTPDNWDLSRPAPSQSSGHARFVVQSGSLIVDRAGPKTGDVTSLDVALGEDLGSSVGRADTVQAAGQFNLINVTAAPTLTFSAMSDSGDTPDNYQDGFWQRPFLDALDFTAMDFEAMGLDDEGAAVPAIVVAEPSSVAAWWPFLVVAVGLFRQQVASRCSSQCW
jgi:hypothetical protein